MKIIKVSAKSARLVFHGCDPAYIESTCHASCCRSSTAKSGIIISIHESELQSIQALGAKVKKGLIVPRQGERKCPFETGERLCSLHDGPYKPFGCIASPFTLNKNDTLIVRNRYKLLKCYKDGVLPAYKAFYQSLVLLFGSAGAELLRDHLDDGGDDIELGMGDREYEILKANDVTKSKLKE